MYVLFIGIKIERKKIDKIIGEEINVFRLYYNDLKNPYYTVYREQCADRKKENSKMCREMLKCCSDRLIIMIAYDVIADSEAMMPPFT